MPNTANNFAGTTDIHRLSSVIDDALRSLRISGSLLLRETYASPWSIAIPNAEKLAALLDVTSPIRVVAFHLIEFGHFAIKPEGGDEVVLNAGEMIICFGGDAHRLFQGEPSEAQSLESLLAGGVNIQSPPLRIRSKGAALLCGVFMLEHTVFNPLFAALPPMMYSTLSRSGEMHNLSGVARLLAEEVDRRSLGGGYVIERLLEVLCAESIRAHIESVSRQETSWFRGVKDPVVGRAIAAIHERPGESWSVKKLADDVAISPSRFAARFAEALGDSPMAYVAKWRMNVACGQLATTRQSIDQVASSVGYESQAAFSRAFKKYVGISPAVWRGSANL